MKKRWIKIYKRLHKWPAFVIAFFALLFAVSGIIMNHRDIFSSLNVSRKLMPPTYTYKNWNQSAVRGSIAAGANEQLIYGNIGIWETDNEFHNFTDFNQGLSKGIDNRKIYSMVRFNNDFFAGTHFGLFSRKPNGQSWQRIDLPVREQRIADLNLKGDTLLVLTRHYLLKSTNGTRFETVQLPAPVSYQRKTGLFETLWQLHSGELLGLPGKLIVDFLGLVTILLSVTGLLHFFFPKIIKRKKNTLASQSQTPKGANEKAVQNLISTKKKNLRWHNVVGYIFALFLIINTFSGMHLRPPLLIAIANKQVGIIPGTHLDSPNPWFDKLRWVQWDDELQHYIFSTSEGFYFSGEALNKPLQPAFSQPPVSVMGCNVLKPLGKGSYLVGSFNGMFVWNTQTGAVTDFFNSQPYVKPEGMVKPISDHMVAGLVEGKNNIFWFDYNNGTQGISSFGVTPHFSAMPEKILKASPMSLWNAALEFHTGRIFEYLIGPFYILYVPFSGICILLVLISGVYLWWKLYRKKR
jgi:hypothetical protein